MFKYIYIVLVIVIVIVLIKLFIKLVELGNNSIVINQRAQEIETKINVINDSSKELETLRKNINEYNKKYGHIARSLITISYIYSTYKKNNKKKSGFKSFTKNIKLITRPNSINSFKTIYNLFK